MRDEAGSAVGPTGELPWRDLYDAHAAELVRFLWKLTGDREVATDLMQETFVSGMRDERALRDAAKVRIWLYRIASRLASKWPRRRRLIAFLPFSGRELSPGEVFDAERQAVQLALRAISADQAVALVLHYAHGFTRGAGCSRWNQLRWAVRIAEPESITLLPLPPNLPKVARGRIGQPCTRDYDRENPHSRGWGDGITGLEIYLSSP